MPESKLDMDLQGYLRMPPAPARDAIKHSPNEVEHAQRGSRDDTDNVNENPGCRNEERVPSHLTSVGSHTHFSLFIAIPRFFRQITNTVI
jgi:hypothetical protein